MKSPSAEVEGLNDGPQTPGVGLEGLKIQLQNGEDEERSR